MGKYKTMLNEGWDISKNKMLRKLSNYAKEGWILESMSTLKFNLIKGEPKDLIYSMDYQPEVEDINEYLEIFKMEGWAFVCEDQGFRIFSAAPGSKPIYTDTTALDESRKIRMKYAAIILAISLITTGVLIIITKNFSGSFIKSICFLILLVASAALGWSSVWIFGLLFRKNK
ncbi:MULTISPECIES: DUF2812 domain-containing protein [Clostridium]|uniref:DUF2812 domain-containing protein n=1 Tax=Clostridium cadaveris TaxID=1529 RepID=A0A1I2P8A8_9CLOT|nr:DUF2812 domain-containing protein [Clostridium cadaveris]MDU4950724.1 DUF2812 domain-containing protein [Clostridium sp.]MDM8312024.1 DUF2812 domain-containing protein [Clostridium cadaveris]MDY4950167.1 DUF2812 domain-containing protein [Clostridium cadaveris]NME63641.1 DUF2812 domain-containing protein [Clostridium cadaveris]PWL54627.1 MAG: DUF2812 domain-containing protein [Clostridium cadaveris]